jgi:hypothetical protein
MWHPYRPLAGLLATDLTRDMGSGMEGPNIQRDHRWTGHVRRRIVRRGKPRPQKFTGKQGSGSGAPHGVVEPSAPDWCYAQPRSIASNSVLYCGRRGTCVEVALKLVGSCWSGCALVEGTQAHGGLGARFRENLSVRARRGVTRSSLRTKRDGTWWNTRSPQRCARSWRRL